ncbi:CsbD family protein [Streptomyces sp. NBC_00234]|uniref:CsbD family protein n=1 Tax=Streptomyces sp. NBC_00234 TaxID=2903638 RepID=UPI002E2AE186|nr:CsbD family protein [Streptomyces sp. NBC_00234]
MGIRKKAKNVGEISKGKTKETVGKAVGNESMEAEGRAEKTKGKVKHAVEKGKDKLRH